jgi:hypothetical protein
MYVANLGLGERSPMALDGWHFGENPRLATPARSVDIYISVEGTKQGKFKGETSMVKGFTDQSRVLKFSYGVVSPRDVSTGQASGKRQHKGDCHHQGTRGSYAAILRGSGVQRNVEVDRNPIFSAKRRRRDRIAADYHVDQRKHFRFPAVRWRRWSLAGRCSVCFSADTDRKHTKQNRSR